MVHLELYNICLLPKIKLVAPSYTKRPKPQIINEQGWRGIYKKKLISFLKSQENSQLISTESWFLLRFNDRNKCTTLQKIMLPIVDNCEIETSLLRVRFSESKMFNTVVEDLFMPYIKVKIAYLYLFYFGRYLAFPNTANVKIFQKPQIKAETVQNTTRVIRNS